MKQFICFFLLSFSMGAFAQGYIQPETEVKYLRLISVASTQGNYLASVDEQTLNMQKLDLPSWDLRNFNNYFANRLSGHRMIFCSVDAYKPGQMQFLNQTNQIGVKAIRACIDESGQVVASGIDTFVPRQQLIAQDYQSLFNLASVPIRPPMNGDNSDRSEPAKTEQSSSSSRYSFLTVDPQ